jgi:hypothetical protein
MRRRGFSLIDSLIGLSLTLLILAASLEFFGLGRRVFFKLKESQEDSLSVLAALEKIRLDAARAGAGLRTAISLGLVKGLEIQDKTLTFAGEDKTLTLNQDLAEGQARLACDGVEDLAKGRVICVFDDAQGEVHSIVSAGRGFVVLSGPLAHSYKREETHVLALEVITYYYDAAGRVIRRKANTSSGQPLLEDAGGWEVRSSDDFALITVSIQIKSKERRYETSFVPKNMALAKTSP